VTAPANAYLEANTGSGSVSDDGVGLPAELDPRATQSLGLDLVFTFAEQLDAKVEIVRDRGTSFRFRFPKGDS